MQPPEAVGYGAGGASAAASPSTARSSAAADALIGCRNIHPIHTWTASSAWSTVVILFEAHPLLVSSEEAAAAAAVEAEQAKAFIALVVVAVAVAVAVAG